MSILEDLPNPATPATPIPEAGIPEVLRNIARDLAGHPLRYRWFGAWWWPIKAMLRRADLASQVPGLGHFLDPEAIATLPRDITPGGVLAEALRQYQWSTLAPLADWTDAPNGDRIRIYDPDLEA